VLVKGRNLVAEQIKHEARWAGVPIVENPPLARSLYRTVEAGQAIPYELYAAVAGILAYLYRQQVEERIRQQQAAQVKAAQVKAAQARAAKAPVSAQTANRPAAGPATASAPSPRSAASAGPDLGPNVAKSVAASAPATPPIAAPKERE